MTRELSVIIPAYNEEENIQKTLLEVSAYLVARGYNFELLVINDGSTDSTVEKIKQAASQYKQIRLIQMPKNGGKGEAVKEGIRHASKSFCLFMDADNSTKISEWEKFEKQFDGGARVVVASRRLPESQISHEQPWIRRFLGGGYRVVCRTLFGLKTKDLNCGFKGYETPIAKKVYAEASMKDWTFDLEILCLLKKEGISVSEVPVSWEHKEKKSNLKPVQAAFKSIASIAKIKRNLSRPSP